jgi:hypothetical protein
MSGLLDLIAVGCLVELSQALDERNYIMEPIPQAELEEIEAATTRYRRFITWFSSRFYLFIEGEHVQGHYIFKRRLVDFAASVVRYVAAQQFDTHKAEMIGPHNLSVKRITHHVKTHFLSGWPELIPPFVEALPSASSRLYYTGPDIKLLRRTPQLRKQLKALQIQVNLDFTGAPLAGNQLRQAVATAFSAPHTVAEESSDEEDQAESHEGQVEDGCGAEEQGAASSPLSSASSSGMPPPPPPTTPPPRKRSRPSPASTPSKTPSSSRPMKRPR